MADLAPNWKLGEFRDYGPGTCELIEVEYENAIAAGDFLKPTGATSDGRLKVSKHTAATRAMAVCPAGQGGASGDVRQVLFRGYIKVTIDNTDGTQADPGDAIKVKANKAVDSSATSAGNHIGFYASTKPGTAAAGDTGIIYFVGGFLN